MAGILHILDQKRLIAPNGQNVGASIFFYTTGTLTPATIYSDAALTTPRANPVVVATGGLVPAIYLDPNVIYRRRIVWTDATLTPDDVDPYIAVGLADASYSSDQSFADGTVGNELVPRVTKSLLKAVAPKALKVAFVQDAGAEGHFVCRAGSPPVTDTFEGLYVVSNTANFYWERVWDGLEAAASWWGVSTALSDNGPRLNAALTMAPVVTMERGIYFVETTVKLQTDGATLRGAGQYYVSDSSQCTRIATTSATLIPIQIGADTEPVGGVNTYPRGHRLEDIFVGRTVGPDKTVKPAGVSVQYCIGSNITRVASVDHIHSFRYTGAVGTHTTETNANRVVAGTGAGADEWAGYFIDGSVDIGLAGGNASIYFEKTKAGCNNASLQAGNSIGYRAVGKPQDTFMKWPESVTCNTGISFESSGSGDADIKIESPIMDQFQKWGIFLSGFGAGSTVNITNPYVGAASAGQFGLFFSSCSGSINVEGGDMLNSGGTTFQGVAIEGSRGVRIDGLILKDVPGVGVGTSGTCSSLVIRTVHHNPVTTGGDAVTIDGVACTASVFEPVVYGKSSAFTRGIRVISTIDNRNEYNLSGVDSACIASGSGNKLVRNAVQITATGLSGTNLVSGVTA